MFGRARRRATVVALGLVALVLVGVDSVRTPWNPPQVVDDSGPVLLQSIRDLERYVPAQGAYEVAVVLREGYPKVPTWVYGYEGVLVAHGTVDTYVDLSGLAADALTVSADRRAVSVRLPAPQLAPPTIDHQRSQVIDSDSGIVNAVAEALDGKADRTQELYRAAEVKISAAATAGDLRGRAERSTEERLRSIGESLGFETVDVTFRPVA